MMKFIQTVRNIFSNEDINFLLTNRIPRHSVTVFMGWFSKIENKFVRNISIGIWRIFTDIDLSEAKKKNFDSLHDCFTRELIPGSRPVDFSRDVLVSPCDGIVGEFGTIRDGTVFQAKGFPYQISELMGPDFDVQSIEGGVYITLRLTSAMYHRFHAPCDGTIDRVVYHSGDTWNVNPIALKRIERLFCLNERAMISIQVGTSSQHIYLVPVAAILVASIRLHDLNVVLSSRYRGPHLIERISACEKGQELGWFEHGSTVLVFAPRGFELDKNLFTGKRIKMGEALIRVQL